LIYKEQGAGSISAQESVLHLQRLGARRKQIPSDGRASSARIFREQIFFHTTKQSSWSSLHKNKRKIERESVVQVKVETVSRSYCHTTEMHIMKQFMKKQQQHMIT